jgi:hypothetical protein
MKMVSRANIVDVDAVPIMVADLNAISARREEERIDPFILSDLLTLRPAQCGGDGRLYRRRRSAEEVAEMYAGAVKALRPRARLHRRTVPDGSGWRWWGVLLPEEQDG